MSAASYAGGGCSRDVQIDSAGNMQMVNLTPTTTVGGAVLVQESGLAPVSAVLIATAATTVGAAHTPGRLYVISAGSGSNSLPSLAAMDAAISPRFVPTGNLGGSSNYFVQFYLQNISGVTITLANNADGFSIMDPNATATIANNTSMIVVARRNATQWIHYIMSRSTM